MKLTDAQNAAFMNDPRRLLAQTLLDDCLNRIQKCVSSNGNAEYYLKTLPRYMRDLSEAHENLIIVEATIESELIKEV